MAKTCLKKKQNIPAIKASFLPRHVAQQDWIFKIIRRGQPLTGNHSNREGNQQEALEKIQTPTLQATVRRHIFFRSAWELPSGCCFFMPILPVKPWSSAPQV